MSDELKPCPFCGGEAKLYPLEAVESPDDLFCCSDDDCIGAEPPATREEWNHRPLEDALQKRIEDLNARDRANQGEQR